MRWFKVLPPLATAAVFSTLAYGMTRSELRLLEPYLDDFEDLCEDALDTQRCDAIDDMADYQREGETHPEACQDMEELAARCEDDLSEDHVTCRLIAVLADDFCEAPVSLPPGQQPEPEPGCGELGVNEVLAVNEEVRSCDGRFVLGMQGDGNLVLYQGDTALWNTETFGNPGATAVMQGDGNLVVYSRTNEPLWNSGTWGNPGATLAVQDDGNVVIYGRDGEPLWASGTCCL